MTSSASSDERLQRLFQRPDATKRIIDKLIGQRSLYGFMETMWPVLEPAEPFVGGWVPEAIAEHLEAVTSGQIKRLLINVPPGCTKSMTTSVFFPSWEWGPRNLPSTRYMLFSYSGDLTVRDNDRAKQLMQSPEYQALWGDRFRILNEAIPEYHNDHKGWRLASSVGAKTTGFRANRLILDDPHNVKDGESEVKRRGAVRWFRESLSTRMNNMERDAIIVIMQRVHENDVSGEILAQNMGYEHLCYDDQTEILTRDGWVKFPDLREGVEVLGVDPKTLAAKWEMPTRYTRDQHVGEMIHYKSLTCDLMVTPDHRMVHKDINDWETDRRSNWRVRAATDLPCDFYVPQAVEWKGDARETVNFGGAEWEPGNFADFMGWYLAEGCSSVKGCATRIVQNDGATGDEISAVLERSPFSFTKRRHGRDGISVWSIGSKPLAQALAPLGKSLTKFMPEEAKNLRPEHLRRLIQAFVRGDGHAAKNNPLKLFAASRSKRLIDDLQECAVKAGWSATVHTHQTTARRFNGYDMPVGPMWRIYIRASKAPGEERKWYSKIRRVNTKRVAYDGMVYCVSVPSTALVVRRNGRVTVSGNCIPMEYDIGRHCVTVLGWQDPRGCDDDTGEKLPDGDELAERDGELCWPERFSPKSVIQLKADLGPYATAGQLQQQPSVRGGAIFVEDWWQEWPTAAMRDALEVKYYADGAENRTITPSYPELDRVIASLDTALGEKETNDFNAITIWGVFRAATSDVVDPRKNLIQGADGVMRIIDSEHSKLMLMYAWQRRLPLHGEPDDMPLGMTPQEWNSPKSIATRQKKWGLVEWTVYLCRRYRVSTLLIENKTRGHDVRNEIFRLFRNEDFGVVMMEPLGDKVQRANALVHLWSNQVVYAPLIFQDGGWGKPAWCATAIDQFTIFPRGANDDIVDSGLHAIKHLRDTGFALRTNESEENYIEEAMHRSSRRPQLPYDV
jgi:phage terminase large subunit-like protein